MGELGILKNLRDRLLKDGYITSLENKNTYYYLKITGQDIFGGACTSSDDSINTYLKGKISVDRKDCFDKYSKCPISLPLPQNKEQMDFIIDKLKWLRSDEGYKSSDEYEFEKWVTKY